jgi:hypothetical protein
LKVPKRRTGIVLVSSLLVILLTTMIMGAGLSISQSGLALQGSEEDLATAHEAAQAGLAYARTRLQEDPNWRGGASGSNTVTVNLPGKLWVRENSGNVLGILTTPNGATSCFRIRFNYQNGSSGTDPDQLDNPAGDMFFNLAYVSENNLNQATSRPVYRAVSSGGTSRVLTPGSPTPFDAGRYSAVILCEGSAGDGLRSLSPTNLAPLSTNRRVSRRVVEAVFTRNLSKIGDAAVNGAMNLDFVLKTSGKMIVDSKDAGVPPRARTLNSVSITAPPPHLTAPVDFGSTGEVYVGPSSGSTAAGTFTVNGAASTAATTKAEDSRSMIPSISWAEVPKASSSGPKMAAGTYVWRQDPRRLEYYAQEFNGTIPPVGTPPTSIHTSAGTLDGGTGALRLDRAEMALTLKKNIYVEPVGSVTGIAIVAEPTTIQSLRNRPDVRLEADASDPNPVFTSQGAITLTGELSGKGSVTSGGNITFQGSSVLEADANGKVAVYSKKDILLEPIPPALVGEGTSVDVLGSGSNDSGSGSGSGGRPAPISSFLNGAPNPFPGDPPRYQDIGFAGLFYAMGNVTTRLGERTAADPGGPAPAASLYFRGVVVAYGGDPEAGQLPGSDPGKGRIDMHGGNVHMVYDSSYIVNSIDFLTPAKLDLTSYQTY